MKNTRHNHEAGVFHLLMCGGLHPHGVELNTPRSIGDVLDVLDLPPYDTVEVSDNTESSAVSVVLRHPDECGTEVLDHHADAEALCTGIACCVIRVLSGEDLGGSDRKHETSFLVVALFECNRAG